MPPASRWTAIAVGSVLHASVFCSLALAFPSSSQWDSYWFSFLVMVVLGSAAESAMTIAADPPTIYPPPNSKFELWVAQSVGIAIAVGFIIAHLERSFGNGVDRNLPTLGVAMLIVGFSVRLWAIATIGHDFRTEIMVPDEISVTGPYRWLKHPAEIGMGLLAIGGTLALDALATTLMLTLVLTPMISWRIWTENQMLESIDRDLTELGRKSSQPT